MSKSPEPLPKIPAMYRGPVKLPLTIRLDADLLTWFKRQGPGWQTKINNALRSFAEKK